MKPRKIVPHALTHCYQRSVDGGILFYSFSDHLVCFTTYCLAARKHHIQVLSLCQMPDHIHDAVRAEKKSDLARFKQDTNAAVARMRNAAFQLEGPVFEKPFGSAQKFGEKSIRTNLIYIGNNPVERHLVDQAEKYRWNYLAYARSDHPFSDRVVIRNARWPLQKAVKEIKAVHGAGQAVSYAMLQRLFGNLDQKECTQLTDFIIRTYNVIDYPSAIDCFGSYDTMLQAMHATTGSEHDLHEVFTGRSDRHYARMISFLLEENMLKDIHDLLAFDTEQKCDLFGILLRKTATPPEQIAKFLHLPLDKTVFP